MDNILSGPGFLGTQAPFVSDLTLVLILLTAALFTLGWQLARHRHLRLHRWLQTATVSFNALVVLAVMVRYYVIHILPGIPARLAQADYAVTTIHAGVGLVGLVLGAFVVLRGNGLVPRRLQFSNYKVFMRTSYAIYMLATLLGVVVYVRTYVLGL